MEIPHQLLKDIRMVLGASKAPKPFTMDVDYNPGNGYCTFIIYADQWHSYPDSVIIGNTEWLNARFIELRNKGILVNLEMEDRAP